MAKKPEKRSTQVTGEELREIRHELVGRIVHQQKAFGSEPNARRAEEYIDANNVMQRIERETEADRVKPTPTPRPRIGAHRWQPRPGDGEPSPLAEFQPDRIRGPNLRGQTATVAPVTQADVRRRLHIDDNPITKAVRARIRFLARHPEFKDRCDKIVFDHAIEDDRGRIVLDNEGKTKLLQLWVEADKKLGAVDQRVPLKMFSIPGAAPKGNVLAGEKIRAQLMKMPRRTLFGRPR